MKEIQLTSVPRLSLSTLIGKVFYEVSIKECNGIMAATVIRDGVTIVDNRRCCAGVPIIPRGHLEDGNFFILTSDDELPYFNQFDGKDQLIYLSQEEIGEISGSFSPWPEVGSIPSSPLVDFDAEYGELGGIALSRSSSATYIDKSGVLRVAAVDEPRFEKEGLLIEGASTNLEISSDRMVTVWSGTTVTVSEEVPIGGGVAYKLTANSMRAGGYRMSNPGFGDSASLTYSIYVKPLVGVNSVNIVYSDDGASFSKNIRLYLDTQAVTANGLSGYKIENLSGGWIRLSISFVNVISASRRRWDVNADPASGYVGEVSMLYAHCQLEPLPFATSYIPTNGAAATRAADKTVVKDSSGYQPVSVYRKFMKNGAVTKELVKSSDLLPAGFYGHLQELKAWHRLLTDEEQAALGVRYV